MPTTDILAAQPGGHHRGGNRSAGCVNRFSIVGVRIAANVLALVLLAYAVFSVARLPRI
jgi:hypothetical protein